MVTAPTRIKADQTNYDYAVRPTAGVVWNGIGQGDPLVDVEKLDKLLSCGLVRIRQSIPRLIRSWILS
jgi:hypothetical protein